MEVRHVRYFLAVAEAGNFTRAAERSYVAQSALSEQVARLEAEIGAKLFHRTSRQVTLTPVGEAFRPLAARIVADVEHAQTEMAALTGVRSGRLRLGIIQSSAGPVDIVDLVTAYAARYPGVELHVRSEASGEMAAAVSTGELDVAVVALPPGGLPPALTHRPIVDDPLVAVVAPSAGPEDARATGPVSLAELLRMGRFIHFLPGSGIRTSVAAALARAGLAAPAAFEVGTVSDMVRLAAAGLGVTVVPAGSAEREAAADPPFTIRPLTDPHAVHPVGVVFDAERLSPAAAAFLTILPGPPSGAGHERRITVNAGQPDRCQPGRRPLQRLPHPPGGAGP